MIFLQAGIKNVAPGRAKKRNRTLNRPWCQAANLGWIAETPEGTYWAVTIYFRLKDTIFWQYDYLCIDENQADDFVDYLNHNGSIGGLNGGEFFNFDLRGRLVRKSNNP
jgi:hypothetical protein